MINATRVSPAHWDHCWARPSRPRLSRCSQLQYTPKWTFRTLAGATTASVAAASTTPPHSLISFHHPRWHSPPSEQGSVSHRSSRPQQGRPDGRAVPPLDMRGAESNLSNDELPQCGQVAAVPAHTNTSNVALQLRQRYSSIDIEPSSFTCELDDDLRWAHERANQRGLPGYADQPSLHIHRQLRLYVERRPHLADTTGELQFLVLQL